MRTRATVLGLLFSIGVIAVGLEAGASVATVAAGTASGSSQPVGSASSSGSAASGSASSAPTTPASSGSSSGSTASKDGTYTGDSVGTRYGNVQVKVTVSGGSITDVTAVHLTDHDGRSIDISNRAAPVLRSEVLSAQSANVSTVGGATYTSDAYLTSLQSALDQAGL